MEVENSVGAKVCGWRRGAREKDMARNDVKNSGLDKSLLKRRLAVRAPRDNI